MIIDLMKLVEISMIMLVVWMVVIATTPLFDLASFIIDYKLLSLASDFERINIINFSQNLPFVWNNNWFLSFSWNFFEPNNYTWFNWSCQAINDIKFCNIDLNWLIIHSYGN